MLPSQRALFDIPSDVCYLNAASYTPLPLATLEAGRAAVGRKGRPWLIDNDFAARQYDRTRKAAARLINADAADVALIPSISYGVATVAKLIPVPPGLRVIVLKDDHSSPVLEWTTRARDGAFTVDAVQSPSDHDWTSAVLAAIARPSAAPVAVVSISSAHWADGAVLDMAAIAGAAHAGGAIFLVDATQGAGVVDLDVRTLDPDFVVFPTYKWLLGPYGRAFIYVAKRYQGGIPLEQTSYGRKAVRAEQNVYFTDTDYVSDARRFDMGERDHFISMEMAAIGMEMMADWGTQAVAARLRALTGRLAEKLHDAAAAGRISFPQVQFRTPHILSLGFHGGIPDGLVQKLAAQKIYVAPRLGRLRVSPHVYNEDADIDRFATALLAGIR
ncbi:MAG TPA: aminotransferase class V-fold PLP-dependent enzyme [Xanthobacteraceae bacterium]|nr:aminotransferase class V-fold PLP-dependent enzyme [Xanthobacteraceae bacterium]